MAVVEDGVTAEAIDDSTTCDLIIIKVVGDPHQQAVREIMRAIRKYGVNDCNRVFIASPGGRRLHNIDAALVIQYGYNIAGQVDIIDAVSLVKRMLLNNMCQIRCIPLTELVEFSFYVEYRLLEAFSYRMHFQH
jgi:hypothetical protein